LSNILSNWIIQKQISTENELGPLGGKNSIVEVDESFFLKEKQQREDNQTIMGVWK